MTQKAAHLQMDDQMFTKRLERHLKFTTVVSNIVAVIMAIGAAWAMVQGFYYKTNQMIQIHSESIQESQREIKVIKENVTSAEINLKVSAAELEDMKEKINRMETKIDKMDDKLDIILLRTK